MQKPHRMDHLPIITQHPTSQIRIPYFCGPEPYDNRGFHDSPGRLGWNMSNIETGLRYGDPIALLAKRATRSNVPIFALQLLRIDWHSKESVPVLLSVLEQEASELASLLQAWWFFGMLAEVTGIPVDVHDFLEPSDDSSPSEQHIHTRNLKRYLDAWLGRLSSLPPQEAMAALKRSKQDLDYVHEYLRMLSDRVEYFDEHDTTTSVALEVDQPSWAPRLKGLATMNLCYARYWKPNGRQILPEKLELSIRILGHTLTHVLKSIFMKLGSNRDQKFVHKG